MMMRVPEAVSQTFFFCGELVVVSPVLLGCLLEAIHSFIGISGPIAVWQHQVHEGIATQSALEGTSQFSAATWQPLTR